MTGQAAAQGRGREAAKVIGPALYQRLASLRTLVVGAGGIGCELLKNLVCAGFADVTIIDLDTIDTSNLNRQFLFQKRHVKRPKALVARETALTFNPAVSIRALHANIKEPRFDTDFFAQFAIVMNALDNLDARRHVNRMCMAAGVPLLESGTAGYRGQVQPIKQGSAECYDCQPKPVPKSYPVCTIRSTPSTPIHCIVWAKSYLFPNLFGVEETDDAELDEAARQGESLEEIENLKREAKDMQQLRLNLTAPGTSRAVFQKVFRDDIDRLLSMEDMWRHRTKPRPLDYEALHAAVDSSASATSASTLLRDQRSYSVEDSLRLFEASLQALASRVAGSPDPLAWDKDDVEALDFATAAANLRAAVFGIPLKTRFEVKEMAGNIIPAIATTNSAVSALLVLQALNVLREEEAVWRRTSRPWFGKTSDRVVTSGRLEPPNPSCETCQAIYLSLAAHPSCTLGRLAEAIQQRLPQLGNDFTLQDGERLLFDPDFDDNLDKTLGELNIQSGSMLTITDEDQAVSPVVLVLSTPVVASQEVSLANVPVALPPRQTRPKTSLKRTEPETPSPFGPSKRIRLDADDDVVVLQDNGRAQVIDVS